jgi:hypothetical protein
VPPIDGADASLIGTAVEFVLPILSGSVREPRIGAARTATALDQRTPAAELAVGELRRLGADGQLTARELERAADCALVCARIDQHYRFGPARAEQWRIPDPGFGEPDGLEGVIRAAHVKPETRFDLAGLLGPALEDTADLYRSAPVYINPDFALSLAMRGADADLIAGGLLVDFKASKHRSVIRSVSIYQLVGYARRTSTTGTRSPTSGSTRCAGVVDGRSRSTNSWPGCPAHHGRWPNGATGSRQRCRSARPNSARSAAWRDHSESMGGSPVKSPGVRRRALVDYTADHTNSLKHHSTRWPDDATLAVLARYVQRPFIWDAVLVPHLCRHARFGHPPPPLSHRHDGGYVCY